MSISVWFKMLYHNLVGDRIDPHSFFHVFAVCWRNGNLPSKFYDLAVPIILVRLDISYVHELF